MALPPAMLDWRPNAQIGPFTVVPGTSNYSVIVPNGAAVSEGDLSSYRYHHHTKVAVFHGRIWVAYSASGTNEDAGGQKTFISISTDGPNPSFGAPVLAVDKQSTFSATGSSFVNGSFITYPRAFVVSGGTLYLAVSLEAVTAGNNITGAALLAVECKSDGTVGAVVRISSASYTPFSGFSEIAYDAVLGTAIFNSANIFGNWGGSTPNNAASAWIGWANYFGVDFTECTTVNLDGSLSLLRFWRRITTNDNRLYAQRSLDGGTTWGSIFRTSVPDSGTASYSYKLSDGRRLLCGNPKDVSVLRDPLYLAVFGSSGAASNIWAVRQGLTDAPVYPGTAKIGGAAYPGMWEDSGRLLISYSMQKESIGLSIIPVANL